VRLSLNEDQEFFRETTRKFLEGEVPLTKIRELYDEPEGFDRDWWRQATELGWTSLLVPEADGGGSLSGAPVTDAVIVAEEMGRLLSPGPFLPVNVVAAALSRAGSDEQRAEVFPELLAGDRIVTWAVAEADGRWIADSYGTSIDVDGDEVVVSGEKSFVEAAAASSHAIVTGSTGAGVSQVLVPLDAQGVEVRPGRSVDMTRRFGSVVLHDVRLPASAVVGELGGAGADVDHQRHVAIALQCAELSGLAHRTLEFTMEYGLERFAFGRPILSFQVLKHRIADMTQWLESSMAVTDELASRIDDGGSDIEHLASVAKVFVGDRAPRVVDECVQITGGIGVTWEHDIQMYNRRAVVDRAVFGTPEEHRERLLPRDPRELQRMVFDAGFAGIAFPVEYGGAGLTLDHQKVFYDTAFDLNRQIPGGGLLMVSVGMLGPTILDHGSEEAKQRFLPPLLRADEIWMQLLSEPRGGSDMAGATTRLDRDGDTYVLSGSKMWSTSAHLADYGLCLCRSDWEAPKHRGLSTIAVPLKDTPGVTIEQTRAADGSLGEFCEEFFDDVILPAGNLIGEENSGWSAAQSLLFHERNAVANVGYGYVGPAGWTGTGSRRRTAGIGAMVTAALAQGADTGVRQQIAEAYVEEVVLPLTSARIMTGMRAGTHKGQWGSLLKLQGSVAGVERARTMLAASGAAGVIWEGEDVRLDNPGTVWLGARGGTLAGGSNEMQRNIISERLVGLPREPSFDRDVPFNEVIRNQQSFGNPK
jgi:alkylation response protein AidB-like acyl-CoA dehydrogenase